MVADGRLGLSRVGLLAPHLTTGNVAELLSMATQRTVASTRQLLAERFPMPDVPTTLMEVAPATAPALAALDLQSPSGRAMCWGPACEL